MSAHRAPTLEAILGVVIAATVALWWLGSSRLALNAGADAGRIAVDTLNVLLLARGIALSVTALHGARPVAGWRSRAAPLGLIAPAWPVAVLAWSACSVRASHLLAAEATLLLAAWLLPGVAQRLRRAWPRGEAAALAGTTIGLGLAAGLWWSRPLWALSAT